ncbi:MAG: DUF5787 family protein [Haloferacaceae archaeon]
MDEYRFELALCSFLEAYTDAVVARQLGGAVENPGKRIVDVVIVEPGPAFDARARLSADTIPARAIESDVGPGKAVPRREALGEGEYARAAIEAAVDAGYFQRERRDGREWIRATARYPHDWFDRLVAIENKPDLGSPGELRRQLAHDATLGLFDAVVLATGSYVTRAHLNRIPDRVGVWRFDPETGDRTVVREPSPLPTGERGIEPLDRRARRTDIAIVDPEAKRRRRLRVAERAYGKGWRPGPATYPECERAGTTADCRPYCDRFERVVDPRRDCGNDCRAFSPGEPPEVDVESVRAERSPWVADPEGAKRRQAGLDRFG